MTKMYQRDHIQAFNNAKKKGLNNPQEYMYMYSLENFDYFKNINFRNYIRFPINIKSKQDIVSTYDDFIDDKYKSRNRPEVAYKNAVNTLRRSIKR